MCSESDRVFHAATAKALSLFVEWHVHGMPSCEADDELSLRLYSRLATGRTSADRYCSADLLRHWYDKTHSLYWILSGTHSQYKSFSNGVTWSYLHVLAVRRAAALTTVTEHKNYYTNNKNDEGHALTLPTLSELHS